MRLPQVGDLITYDYSNRYCVVHKIMGSQIWGVWVDSEREALAEYAGLKGKNPIKGNPSGYNELDSAVVRVKIVTPAKVTIKDYLEAEK